MPTPPLRQLPRSARECFSRENSERVADADRRRAPQHSGYTVLINDNTGEPGEHHPVKKGTNTWHPEHKGCRAIDPRRSGWFEVWDTVMISALLEVAIFTPYELAFQTPAYDYWFFKNRVIDVVFWADIVMRFLTAVPDPTGKGAMVTDLSQVARLYLSQWFICDILSTFPWDAYYLMALRYRIIDPTAGSAPEIFRLLRILRLMRLTNGKSILRRFNIYFGFQWKALTMMQNFMFLLLVCHWSACLWGGLGLREPAATENTWLEVLQKSKGGPDELYQSSAQIYLIALYWAVMTITGIGYGDITPQNSAEYLAAVFLMTGMAAGWAYIIGEITASMSNLNPHEVGFKQSVDALNSLLLDWNVPHALRKDLRAYFNEAKDLWRYLEQKRTLDQLSPYMQGQVSMKLHNKWIQNVRYLRDQEVVDLMPVLHHLRAMMYGPGEITSGERCIYIVWRGLCVRRGRIFSRNDIWGEDMVLHNELLRTSTGARSVGYVELFMLVYDDLMAIAEKVPGIRAAVRKHHKWIALLRSVVLIKRIILELHHNKLLDRHSMSQDQRMAISDEILAGNIRENLSHDGMQLQRAASTLNLATCAPPMDPSKTLRSARTEPNLSQIPEEPKSQTDVASPPSFKGQTASYDDVYGDIVHHHTTSSYGSYGNRNVDGTSPALKRIAVELVEEFLARAQQPHLHHSASLHPSQTMHLAHYTTGGLWAPVVAPAAMVRSVAHRGLNFGNDVAQRMSCSIGWR